MLLLLAVWTTWHDVPLPCMPRHITRNKRDDSTRKAAVTQCFSVCNMWDGFLLRMQKIAGHQEICTSLKTPVGSSVGRMIDPNLLHLKAATTNIAFLSCRLPAL